jgi:hypothetical protein
MRGSAAWDQWLREESKRRGLDRRDPLRQRGGRSQGYSPLPVYALVLAPATDWLCGLQGIAFRTGGAAMDQAAAASITARAGRTAFGEVAIVGAIGGGGVAVGRDDTPIANQKSAWHLANVTPRCPERVAL